MPIIGSFNMSASSNVLGTSDIIDLMDSGSDLYSNDKLFDRLKADNRLNVNLNTDILSFGWYRGKRILECKCRLACRFRCGIGKGHVLYDAHDEWFCIGGCGRNQSKL